MEGQLFATKGLEYLITVGYMVLLVATYKLVQPRLARRYAVRASADRAVPLAARPWFALADGYHFHRGHSWVSAPDGEMVTVGLDDFAATLLGAPDALDLPAPGTDLRQGDRGWSVRTGDRTAGMLSPVNGTVVAVNQAVLDAPRLAADDPYGAGWLFKVRAPDRKASLRNLFSGPLAAAWMQHDEDRLRQMPAGGLGAVMADGGMPMRGFGRTLAQDEWEYATREFLLAD